MSNARDLAKLSPVQPRLSEVGNSDGALSNRNHVINGNFDVWQRGVSGSLPYSSGSAELFVADRWSSVARYAAVSVSRQEFSLGQTDVPNATYFHRHTITNLDTTSGYVHFDNRMEDLRKYDGQTITVTFYAKASSNTTLGFEFTSRYDSTPESNGQTYPAYNLGSFSLTTSWQKFTATVQTTSLSGVILGGIPIFTVRFVPSTGSSLQSRWGGSAFLGDIDIAQVQLEYGDTATPFEHRSYGAELALCQRYYWRGDVFSGYRYAQNIAVGPKQWPVYFSLPVEMRVTPTATAAYTNVDASRNGGLQHLTATNGMLAMTSSYAGEYAAAKWEVTADAEL